jgi:lysozyme
MSVLSRWKNRLATRKRLTRKARAEHVAHPTPQSREKLEHRKQQEAFAQRVVDRHEHATRISKAGVDLIKEFEGFPNHGRPYLDPVGVWTIGYGHTENVGPNSKPLTEREASALLQRDLDAKYAPTVARLDLPLNQNQFDALVSFVYNLGPGAISARTRVGKALRRHDWKAAADHLLEWDRAGGRRLPGLSRRRQAERALFLRRPS